jgi:hypothetical protein
MRQSSCQISCQFGTFSGCLQAKDKRPSTVDRYARQLIMSVVLVVDSTNKQARACIRSFAHCRVCIQDMYSGIRLARGWVWFVCLCLCLSGSSTAVGVRPDEAGLAVTCCKLASIQPLSHVAWGVGPQWLFARHFTHTNALKQGVRRSFHALRTYTTHLLESEFPRPL